METRGPALGFAHEHTNSEDRVPYDEAKVIAFYKAKEGWDEKTTRDNVLTPNAGAPLLQPRFDKRSIMSYSVPEELLDKSHPRWKDYVTGNNHELSETDKAMARKWYL